MSMAVSQRQLLKMSAMCNGLVLLIHKTTIVLTFLERHFNPRKGILFYTVNKLS